MAGFACFTFLLLAIGMLIRQNRQPLRDDDEIKIVNGVVAVGFRKLPKATWLWSPELRTKVTLWALQENQLRVASLRASSRTIGNLAVQPRDQGLSFFVGFCGSQELVIDLVDDGPHAFICGPTGSGKSQFLMQMLYSLIETYDAERLNLFTLDFKGGATLGSFGTRATASTTDLDENQQAVFEAISRELRRREELLQSLGASRVEQVANLPRLVIAVDELAAVLQIRGALEVLESVAARGRSLGVHLVATAQSTSGIPRSLLVNLGLRIAIGNVDALEQAQLGMKPMTSSTHRREGLLIGQLSGAGLSANFGFPIHQVKPKVQEIWLTPKIEQSNPRIL